MNPRLYNGVVIVVTVVWCLNFGARLLLRTYEPPVQVDAIFMAVVGGAMALSKRGGPPSGGESK